MVCVYFAAARTSPRVRIMHVCRIGVFWLVGNPSNSAVYRCELRDGVDNKFFFVIFFRFGNFRWVTADKIGELAFFSGSVFEWYVEVV